MSIRKSYLQAQIDVLDELSDSFTLDVLDHTESIEQLDDLVAKQNGRLVIVEKGVARLYDFLNTVIDRVNIQKLAIEELNTQVDAAICEGDVAYDNIMDTIAELRRHIKPSKIDQVFKDIFSKPAPGAPLTDLEKALKAGKEWAESTKAKSTPNVSGLEATEPYAEQGPYKTAPKDKP